MVHEIATKFPVISGAANQQLAPTVTLNPRELPGGRCEPHQVHIITGNYLIPQVAIELTPLGHGVGLLNLLAHDRAQIIRISLVRVLQPAQNLLQQVISAIGRIPLHLRQHTHNGRFAAGIGQISHQAHDYQDLRHEWHNQHDREWQASQLLNHENSFLIKVFFTIEVAASSGLPSSDQTQPRSHPNHSNGSRQIKQLLAIAIYSHLTIDRILLHHGTDRE